MGDSVNCLFASYVMVLRGRCQWYQFTYRHRNWKEDYICLEDIYWTWYFSKEWGIGWD